MTQTTFTDNVLVDGSQDIEQLRVQGHSTQDDALQTWEDSAGDVLAQVTGDGRLLVGDDVGLASPDALIEAHRDEASTTKPKRGFHSLGQVSGTLATLVQWIVGELELHGSNAIDALHTALRIRATNKNTGTPGSSAELRGADIEVINDASASEDALTKVTGLQIGVTNATDKTITDAAALRLKLDNAGTITNPYAIHSEGPGVTHLEDFVELKQVAAPTTPATDFVRIYPKSDGKLYAKNWSGTEFDLTENAVEISDGTTTVDPTTLLNFDPTYFDVSDVGGGQADVTFVGPDTGITQLTGDVTAGPGSGSQAATVASVGGASAANVAKAVAALADKFLVQTADATNLPNAQAMGALATGLVKNTTTTGVQSIATAGTDYTSPTGTENLSNKTITESSLIATALSLLLGGFKAIFTHANTADRTYTFPDATGNVILDSAAQTLTNKKFDDGVVLNESGADSDTRIEGDTDANLLFVDAGTDRIGIGTNAPTAKLNVEGSVIINDNSADVDVRVESNNDANNFFSDGGNDNIGIGTGSPDASAKLHVVSTSKGAIARPVMTAAQVAAIASPAEGLRAYESDTEHEDVYDGQRFRSLGKAGWTPYAFPLWHDPSNPFTSGIATLAANGGSLAIAVHIPSHMLLQSVSVRQAAGSLVRTWAWDLYEQYLNNGNSGENSLTRVAASNGSDSFTASAVSTRTLAANAVPVYLAPGIYWLVLQNRHASNTFLVSISAGLTLTNGGGVFQTKTTSNPNGSTLDFVAATWTKSSNFVGVMLNGRVFGQTAAF